ncbi:transposable element Tcb1 transposase [Trichonephila clavipes]|nr:transposable element Tcb1 transposase [Trichonephila clavipes]
MWSMLTQRLTQITPPAATPDQLWQRVEAAWSAVPQEHIQSLFESMPRRVTAEDLTVGTADPRPPFPKSPTKPQPRDVLRLFQALDPYAKVGLGSLHKYRPPPMSLKSRQYIAYTVKYSDKQLPETNKSA